MKKILVINNKYKTFGGEDSNIIDELDFLKNYFIVEYLEFDNGKRITFNDIKAFFSNSNKSSNKALIEIINKFNPDIVYVHNTWFKSNLGIFKILKDRNIKTLLKLHNFRYDCTKSFLASKHLQGRSFCPKCGLSTRELRFFNKYYKNSYLKSFFVTRYGKEYFKILKNYPLKIIVMNKFHNHYLQDLGIPKEKISIGLNPMNLDEINNEDFKKESTYVVYAGRLTDSKGVQELLSSWIDLKIDDLILKIIGTGDIEKQLKNQYSYKNIDFVGELENKETINLIKNARAVITATKMYEGQPRLLCEASSLGVPSIYPSFGGMDEFFPSDYKLSFEQYNYSDLKKKITLLQDSNFLTKESTKAYNHIKKKLDREIIFKEFDHAISTTGKKG